MEEQPKYGKLIAGVGTSERRELEIAEFIQSDFKDHRTISICKLEDDTYIFGLENPKSTGRADQQTMWLSKESAVGLITSAIIYFASNGIDFREMITESLDTGEVNIRWSDNMHTRMKNLGIVNK